MKKLLLLLVLVCGMAQAQQDEWKLDWNITDEFGDVIGSGHWFIDMDAKFTNSATTNSKCPASFKYQVEEDGVFLQFAEYGGWNNTAHFSDYNEYYIKYKDVNGLSGKAKINVATNKKGLWFKSSSYIGKKIFEALARGNVKFVVGEEDSATRYFFEIDKYKQ